MQHLLKRPFSFISTILAAIGFKVFKSYEISEENNCFTNQGKVLRRFANFTNVEKICLLKYCQKLYNNLAAICYLETKGCHKNG
jgi:hypothetical protein